jgi:hypothetical protein
MKIGSLISIKETLESYWKKEVFASEHWESEMSTMAKVVIFGNSYLDATLMALIDLL